MPINNRNVIAPIREQRDTTTVPFDFSDLSKVKQATPQSDMDSERNTIKNDGSQTALYKLLQDPETATTFLKNIFFLREIVGIMMLNNNAETQELANLMQELMVSPENIASELSSQEAQSTLFRGELFDILRSLSDAVEMRETVAVLLKALNAETSRETVISALKNTMQYLEDTLSVSDSLSGKLNQLVERLDTLLGAMKNGFDKGCAELYKEIKGDALSTFSDIENSVLFSEQLSQVVGMAKYSLSRVNTNEDFLNEALSNLLNALGDGNDQLKEHICTLISRFLSEDTAEGVSPSMKALAEILEKGAGNEVLKTLNPESMEKIIMSMLSCPCNFTPLLHYVVPVEYNDESAFAEMWINPDGDEDRPEKESKRDGVIHVLIVFEIERIGRMETELFVDGKKISLLLGAPEESLELLSGLSENIRKATETTGFTFEEIRIEKLAEQRSLVEVFKSLPLRRMGLNVSI